MWRCVGQRSDWMRQKEIFEIFLRAHEAQNFDANAKADKQPDAVLIVLSQKKGVGARAPTPFLKRAKSIESKKPTLLTWAFCNPGTGLFFQAVSRQVLSLLTVFTFVFGMGTGVFRSQWHQVC